MDCQTILLIIGLALGVGAYKLLDKYFPLIFMGSMWLIRAFFILLVVGALALGGFTGEEIVIGAAWAAIEWLAGRVKPIPRQDDEEDEEE